MRPNDDLSIGAVVSSHKENVMDESLFDLLAKRVATATSRRDLLRRLGGTFVATAIVPLGISQTTHAQSQTQRIAACTDFCIMVSENIGVPQTRSACADACRACAGDVEPVCLADADSQDVVCCPDRAPCSTVCGDLPGGVPPPAA
jgi:hypothetical protein